MKRLLLACFPLLLVLPSCEKTAAETADKKKVEEPEILSVSKEMVQSLLKENLANMVYVKGGSFMMGDGYDEETGLPWTIGRDNKPVHKVTLGSYYIGKYEVTYREHDIFATVTGKEPSLIWLDRLNLRKPEIAAGVSWYDAKDYCQWLGERTGLPFDLPTEAQWEYAARSRGEDVYAATDNGNIEPERNYPGHIRNALAPGQFPPNPLGIHDMSGNVIEWVNDWYDPDYYQNSPEKNPQGPEGGQLKIKRGGSFLESPEGGNVYTRQELSPETDYKNVGFRCVLNVSDPPEVFNTKALKILEQLK